MSEQITLSKEVEARQHDLFEQALRDGEFPEELTPEKVIEALRFPEHFPAVIRFLRKLANDARLTYGSERAGTFYDPNSSAARAQFTLKYTRTENSSRQPRIETKRPISKRLYAACVAHAGESQSLADMLYYLMQVIIQPKLGYEFALKTLNPYRGKDLLQIISIALTNPSPVVNRKQYGDYNLLLKFLTKHRRAFEVGFFATKNLINKEAARVAAGKNGINMRLVAATTDRLSQLGLEPDLQTANVSKKKIQNPETSAFPRAHETTTTQRFAELFIELDLNNPEAVAKALGLTQAPSIAECRLLKLRFAPIETLLLCLLDTQQLSAQNLFRVCHPDLERSTYDFVEFATAPSHQAQELLQTLVLDRAPLKEVFSGIQQQLESTQVRGLGAAQALSIAWSHLNQEISSARGETSGLRAQADALQKLMLHAVLLLTDPAYAETYAINTILE